MPNRILKESICRSDEIDSLSWFEECLFYRLIVNCDDFGRFDGREKIINNICFPLKDLRDSDLKKALDKLSAVGLVRRYTVQGRPVLQLVTWECHQQIRAKKSKYPGPEEATADDIICNHLISNDIKCSRNPIQSNRNRNTNTENVGPEPERSEPTAPPVISLILNTGDEYPFFQKDIDDWSALYPNVDVMQEMRSMKGWCMNNPSKRKTKRGIRAFVNRWLAKEQDKGPRTTGTSTYPSQSTNRFLNFQQSGTDWNAVAERIMMEQEQEREGGGT